VKKKVIIVNREDIISPFMEERLSANGGFRNGRALGLAEIDNDTNQGELIAGVWYEWFNGANMNMHVAAVPGRRWMTREFLFAAFAYPFNDAGVRRVTGIVAESNHDARRFDEHLGFSLEARLKDAAPDGDLLVYRMFKDECRWLRMKPHGAIKEH
jgi:RimJ/RimL family protein N-acetyltransferase